MSRAPDLAAARLGELLGATRASVDGRPALHLGGLVLEVVALPPEDRGDDRLGFGPTSVPDAHDASDAGVTVVRCVGVGLATVDTERFASQLGWRMIRAAPDLVLGARATLALDAGIEGVHLLILEPVTEGRVAASLARWGEGPVALYLRPGAGLAAARERVLAGGGQATPTASDGPFGRSFAVAGGLPWGPHLVFVESDAVATVGGDQGSA